MQKSSQQFRVSLSENEATSHSIPASVLALWIEDYFADLESGQVSPRTVEMRRFLMARLVRFMKNGGHDVCGVGELRLFFADLKNERTGQPLRPVTVETYRQNFAAFCNWLIREDLIAGSPMLRIRKPPVKNDIIQPLGQTQIEALLAAARRDENAVLRARNVAILLFLLDTGARSAEARCLIFGNLDLLHRQARLLGKGNKWRTVYFSQRTSRALHHYLSFQARENQRNVFLTESGLNPHSEFTRRGFYSVISKLFLRAGLTSGKRGPHVLRHTFAIQYLRGGGRQKELMLMLGHEDMKQTNGYVALADADLEEQHRLCSPVERMRL